MGLQNQELRRLQSEQPLTLYLLAVVLGNAASYVEQGSCDPLLPLLLRSRWSQIQGSLKDMMMMAWLYGNVTAGQQASADGEGAGETK